jgi:MFS family permease
VTDFNITFTKAGYLITVNLLFLGLGNLFWIPLSEKIGKRPVLIACSGLFFVSTIWAAASRSWGSLFGARIVQGFAASVSEGLGPVIVADVYFLHERGLWVGVNLLTFTVGTSLGGIFSGLIANATPNWHWVYWHQVFLTGMIFLVIVLFQAETNFNRPQENESGEGLPASQLAAIRARVKSRWIKSLGVTSWYNRYVKILCVMSDGCGGFSLPVRIYYVYTSLSLTSFTRPTQELFDLVALVATLPHPALPSSLVLHPHLRRMLGLGFVPNHRPRCPFPFRVQLLFSRRGEHQLFGKHTPNLPITPGYLVI